MGIGTEMTNSPQVDKSADKAPESVVKEPAKPTIGAEISLFTKHVNAIGILSANLPNAVQRLTEAQLNALREFENQKCEVTAEKTTRKVAIPYLIYRDWKKLKDNYEHFTLSRSLLTRSLLVSLVSQFDAYVGRLFRTVFLRKPEILNGSDKQITFQALSEFPSLETAREYFLEKEIEGILRSSHYEQFKTMERLFKVTLTKDLEAWPTFIEITERRNLFVHTDGVVSSQYIAVCKAHGCEFNDGVKEGSRLPVTPVYLKQAQLCIYEIGVKLGHVLWRKLFSDERKLADSNYVALTYELLSELEYDLAIRLLDFGCSIPQKSSEAYKLMFIVNRAQAYKWKGDNKKCRDIMLSEDWEAKSDEFKLADAVLADDWERASMVMKQIGSEGPVAQADYRDWPLFRDFRKEKLFLETYEKVFGTSFAVESEVRNAELSAPLSEGGRQVSKGSDPN